MNYFNLLSSKKYKMVEIVYNYLNAHPEEMNDVIYKKIYEDSKELYLKIRNETHSIRIGNQSFDEYFGNEKINDNDTDNCDNVFIAKNILNLIMFLKE